MIDPAHIVIVICALLSGAFGFAVVGGVLLALRARDRRKPDPMMQAFGDQPGFTPGQREHFRRRLLEDSL